MKLEPFDITRALKRVEKAVAPFPKAAMFELKERGHGTLFEQLVACVLSIRTRDEVSLPLALQLFAHARTPRAILALAPDALLRLIRGTTFPEPKVRTIREIARAALDSPDGDLPADPDALRALPGIGPKCAHLALGVARGLSFISVDVHVHRVTQRWGYVQARTPEKALAELERKLPRKHWIEINRLLVPFGKHICKGGVPLCPECPLNTMCPKVGVQFATRSPEKAA